MPRPDPVAAWWLVPSRNCGDRLIARGVRLREACRGLCHAIRTLAGLYTRSRGARIYEVIPASGWGPISSPALFLLPEMAVDARALFDRSDLLMAEALELLESCDCARGCTSCTGRHELPAASSMPEIIPDRAASAALARCLLGRDLAGDDGTGGRRDAPADAGPRVIRVSRGS